MEMSAPRLEELRLQYNFGGPSSALEGFETCLIPMFQSGKWKRLRKVVLLDCAVPEVSVSFYPFEAKCLTVVSRMQKIVFDPTVH